MVFLTDTLSIIATSPNCRSRSTSATRFFPDRAIATARFDAIVVFPTPPFVLNTVITLDFISFFSESGANFSRRFISFSYALIIVSESSSPLNGLHRYSRAPAVIAFLTYSVSPCTDIMMTTESGMFSEISSVAFIPSMPGMFISIRITSGRISPARTTASSPVAASAVTLIFLLNDKSCFILLLVS